MATTGSVVVTGASSGIGEACALRLDRLGFQVFAGVRREVDGGALKQKASDRLTPILLDVTDAASIKSAADTLTALLGETGLTGLVNNAGIAVAGPLEFLPIDELRRQFEVNVIGQIAVTQAFLPLLRRGHGRVVNMGSIAGKSALPFIGPYSASKFAMEALTDSLRMELLPWNIPVSIIEPASVATPIWQKSLQAGEKVAAILPPQAHELYGHAIVSMSKMVSNIRKTAPNNGVSTDVVARAVEHALTAKKPRTRYLVGTAALLRLLLGILPDRARDRLITWRLLG
jgi:NAD(P)-dependent dehydrogenase (short-subunit alcohol dehydrogenase family)